MGGVVDFGTMALRRALAGIMGTALALGLVLPGQPARADDKKKCAAAYEKAQELRQAAKIRQARDQLIVCAQASCPEFVRADCGKWLDEVEAGMASVVFVARDAEGNDLTEVTVRVGDEVLVEQLDGKAVPVDPGAQVFIFEVEGEEPIEKKVIVAQGEKSRVIAISFGGGADAPDPEDDPDAEAAFDTGEVVEGTPNRTLAYILGGVGVVGLVGFAAFGASGKSQEDDLRATCSPNCDQDKVDEVKSKYLLADISLGVGVVSLGVATYLFINPPTSSDASSEQARMTFDVAPTSGGGYASVRGRF